MNIVSIVGCLGVILCASTAVYNSMRYISISNDAKTIEALMPGVDVMAPKIESLLAEHKDKDLIMREFNARHDHGASQYAALWRIVSETKTHALYETLLWIIASSIFFILLVYSERRVKK